jgi:type IV secretion system protein VirB1
MILGAAAVIALALRCAPNVAPQTLLAVAQAESGLNPFAIGVNRAAFQAPQPQSRAEAVKLATSLLAGGANLDLGLAQINSANLARLGLTVDDAFDPCRSLAASATVLEAGYRSVIDVETDPQHALRTAFSLYNTGDRRRGFRNGYVARVERSAVSLPPIEPTPQTPHAEPSRTSSWDAFGELRPAAFVIFPSPRQGDQP